MPYTGQPMAWVAFVAKVKEKLPIATRQRRGISVQELREALIADNVVSDEAEIVDAMTEILIVPEMRSTFKLRKMRGGGGPKDRQEEGDHFVIIHDTTPLPNRP